MRILVCTMHTAYAEKDDCRCRLGVKLGVSSASFRNPWKSLEEFNLQGEVQKGNFFGKPQFCGSTYLEFAANRYFGFELGIDYLRQGGILKVTKQSGTQSVYLKIIQHTISIPLGLCIYPLGWEADEGIWKIVTGIYGSFIPKRTWAVKGYGTSEKKIDCPKPIKTLLQGLDGGFFLGTDYEWACGWLVGVRGGIGMDGILRQTFRKDASIGSIMDTLNAYQELSSDKRDDSLMKNYYFTLTIGYSFK